MSLENVTLYNLCFVAGNLGKSNPPSATYVVLSTTFHQHPENDKTLRTRHTRTHTAHLQFSVRPAKDKAKEPEQAHRRPDDRDPGDRVIGPSICQLITLVCLGFQPYQPLHVGMIGFIGIYKNGRPIAGM